MVTTETSFSDTVPVMVPELSMLPPARTSPSMVLFLATLTFPTAYRRERYDQSSVIPPVFSGSVLMKIVSIVSIRSTMTGSYFRFLKKQLMIEAGSLSKQCSSMHQDRYG
jgi:hypothetical protein